RFAGSWSDSDLAALFDQAPVLGRIDLFKHGLHARARLAQGADGLGFLAGGADLLDGVFLGFDLLLVRPFAQHDQVLLQALDGVAQRPLLGLVAWAIAAGVVRRRVRGAAIGEQLDHRRALVGA